MTERHAFVFDKNLIVSTDWDWDLVDIDLFGDLYSMPISSDVSKGV